MQNRESKLKKKRIQKSQNNTYTIYGMNNCREILIHKKYRIDSIEIMKESNIWGNEQFQEFLHRRPHSVKVFHKSDFLKKHVGIRHQGVVIHFNGKLTRDSLPDYSNSGKNICLLAVDTVEDPQNLGQIIRTSECAGIDGLIIPRHSGSGITNAVLQVSQGAFLHLPIFVVPNFRNTFNDLKKQGFWVVGFENSLEAKKWYEIDYKGKIICVVGSEGKGIRHLVLRSCDFHATIPMYGKTNSLNVSASVSAILFERNRQIH